MKRLLVSSILLIFLNLGSLFAQLKGGDILGLWYAPAEGDGSVPVVEIFENEGKYYAYGFMFKPGTGPVRTVTPTDEKNPDPSLRTRPRTEVVFLYDVKFNAAKQEWGEGEIYNPLEGKYFYVPSGKLSKDGSTLNWRASIDKGGALGKTIKWVRIDTPQDYAKEKRPARGTLINNIPEKRMKK